jgi:hypothetical protein
MMDENALKRRDIPDASSVYLCRAEQVHGRTQPSVFGKISSPFCSPETVHFFEVKKRCTDIELSGILFSFCLCYSWC